MAKTILEAKQDAYQSRGYRASRVKSKLNRHFILEFPRSAISRPKPELIPVQLELDIGRIQDGPRRLVRFGGDSVHRLRCVRGWQGGEEGQGEAEDCVLFGYDLGA